MSDPLPRCKLTRRATIEFLEINGKMHLLSRCNCGYMNQESQTCRHVKHVMSQIPTLEHFHPRCFKSYSQFVCKNDEHTKIVEKCDTMFNDHDGMMFDASPFNG